MAVRNKIFLIGAPIAAFGTNWFNCHSKNVPMSSPTVQAAEQNMKLEQVQVIFRHGARTPISWSKERFQDFSNIKQHVWDKDKLSIDLPGVNISYTVKLPDGSYPTGPMLDVNSGARMEGGCMTGQLTYVGKQQIYDLGKWLSEKYIVNEGLISSSFKRNDIYVRSSYRQRTIQSAVCLLAGLFEETGQVCIETNEADKEDITPNLLSCTNMIKWHEYIHSLQLFPSAYEEENYINGLMGKVEYKKNISLVHISDLMHCRRAHSLSIPQVLLDNEEIITKFVMEIAHKYFGKGNVNIVRNCIGSFLETVCCRITESIEGLSSHKMFLYSAHDVTIFPMLIALGVDVDVWPPFASHLIIELYKGDDNKHFIRVLYNGKPIIFDSDSGQDYLPAERFLKLMEVYRVVDFDADCGNV